jgi:hypothetical protein
VGRLPNVSKKSLPIAFRIPRPVWAVIERRAAKAGFTNPKEYLRERIVYDITRSHHKK